MDAHTTGKVAEELVSLRFVGVNPYTERRVWVALLHDADEFDDILGQMTE